MSVRGRMTVMTALVLVPLFSGCDLADAPAPRFKGTDITGAGWARNFELSDDAGRRRTLADFKGKVIMLFFGYTNCPGPCPTALAEMAQVVKQIGADRVQGLFVTVDPERDTPEKLGTYVTAFHYSFLGLRGSQNELEKATKEFKIYYRTQRDDKGGHSGHGGQHGSYMVDHSTGIYVLDTRGRARIYFSANDRSVSTMVSDIKLLLESGPR